MIEPSANPPDKPTSELDGPPSVMPRSAATESSHVAPNDLGEPGRTGRIGGELPETASKAVPHRLLSKNVGGECDRTQPPSALEQWCNEHLLSPTEQLAAAVWTSVALVCLAMWWVWQGGATGRTIDVDRAPAAPISFVVNVNEADWPELSVLPGIGPVLAQRIVASREKDGPFRSVDDLRRVRGIGPITLERLRPHVAVLSSSDSAVAEAER